MIKINSYAEKGFTLIEVLVTCTILVIVLGIAFNFLKTGFKLDRQTNESIELQQNIRFAMDSVLRDLKNANNVQLVNDHRIRFNEGQNNHQVDYYISGQQLIRDENNSNSPVAENITNIDFTKQNFLVTISITANKNDRQVVLRSNIYLRRDSIE